MHEPEDRNPETVRRIFDAKFDVLLQVSSSSATFIFKAPRQLRQVNERAYEPQIISIGPYHRGKDHLKGMETLKARYLFFLLQQPNNLGRNTLGDYIAGALDMELPARDCYAESTENMSSADFVAMMVLDGLFVIELIRKFTDDESRDETDALFKQNSNLTILAQDLLLFENQLPFFVLARFAGMTGLTAEDFAKNALRFFSGVVQAPVILYEEDRIIIRDNMHLLGLVHVNWLPSPGELNNRRVPVQKWNLIRSATELLEVGIRFKKGRGNSLFDIKFQKGQMHIPTLIVNHDTERIFRNLIAYEQHFDEDVSIVMDYARLMDSLINYADDVALLSSCGIIENLLGSNEEVANMFNRLNDYVYLSTANFYYFDVCQEVNRHCRRPLNLWKVKLRQKYFQSPWDWILTSIVAATILLQLSLVQTIFSVMAYFK